MEFEHLDEDSDDIELLKGQLIRMPCPPYIHMESVQRLWELLKSGAAEVWLIYPKPRNAWVYDVSGAAHNETRSIHTSLLPGVDIPLAEILS